MKIVTRSVRLGVASVAKLVLPQRQSCGLSQGCRRGSSDCQGSAPAPPTSSVSRRSRKAAAWHCKEVTSGPRENLTALLTDEVPDMTIQDETAERAVRRTAASGCRNPFARRSGHLRRICQRLHLSTAPESRMLGMYLSQVRACGHLLSEQRGRGVRGMASGVLVTSANVKGHPCRRAHHLRIWSLTVDATTPHQLGNPIPCSSAAQVVNASSQ